MPVRFRKHKVKSCERYDKPHWHELMDLVDPVTGHKVVHEICQVSSWQRWS